MPEALIGLFPDVGASYFLSRLPGSFGIHITRGFSPNSFSDGTLILLWQNNFLTFNLLQNFRTSKYICNLIN